MLHPQVVNTLYESIAKNSLLYQVRLNTYTSVLIGQWSEVSGQRSVVRGQWSEVSGQRSVVRGQWSEVSGQKVKIEIMPTVFV
jgi:hypothetical protein